MKLYNPLPEGIMEARHGRKESYGKLNIEEHVQHKTTEFWNLWSLHTALLNCKTCCWVRTLLPLSLYHPETPLVPLWILGFTQWLFSSSASGFPICRDSNLSISYTGCTTPRSRHPDFLLWKCFWQVNKLLKKRLGEIEQELEQIPQEETVSVSPEHPVLAGTAQNQM